jgi:hypothetical protein
MELAAIPELWGHPYLEGTQVAQRRERAAQFADAIERLVVKTGAANEVDELFDRVAKHLIGGELEDFRRGLRATYGSRTAEGYEDRAFRDMVRTLRGDELAGLGEEDHRPARSLMIIAGEVRLLPYAEGTLEAIKLWPRSARLDLRSAFHTITRWGADRSPAIARLVAAALTKDCPPQPWGPFSRLFERVLSAHKPYAPDRKAEAIELSKITASTLYAAYKGNASKGETMRRLLDATERAGILDPHDDDVVVRAALRPRVELAQLLLARDLHLALDVDVDVLVDLLHE